MSETRSPVLLTRLAKKLRKESKDKRYRARIEDERASLRQLIYISSTRPICRCPDRSCEAVYTQVTLQTFWSLSP